jgi:molybdopterin-synthase adenylyltransferase
MISAELRIPRDLHELLRAYITQAEEWVGYLLCGVLETSDRLVFLAREWCPIPERYRIRGTRAGMTWNPDFDVEMLNRAQRGQLACAVVHYHTDAAPALSRTDRDTCASLLPFLSREASRRPHAFVVMGEAAAVGRVYHGGAHIADLSTTRIAGSSLVDWPTRAEALELQEADPDSRHDRLTRGFGTKAIARLKAARVGMVGAGGGGSHVIQQLAYLGVGTLIISDGDCVELSNLNRLMGAIPARRHSTVVDRLLSRGRGDVGLPKIEVMQRLVHKVAEDATVVAYFEHFPSAATVRALRECDVIVACVDRLQVRDDLNRLCKRYLIPLIDVGLEIVADHTTARTVTAIPGRVTKVQPDGPCLRCQGIVDDAKLERERGGRPPGYTGDPRLPDPAVVTLNGAVASIAATEVLQALTGFAGTNSPNCGWLYDGLTGTVDRVVKTFRGCPACLTERASGDA